jgi:hypothetical protein
MADPGSADDAHARELLKEAYAAFRPMIMYVYGRPRSAVIAAVFGDRGMLYADDGAISPDGASHHVDHMARFPVSGGSNAAWAFADGIHEIREVRPDDVDYHGWRYFEENAGDSIALTRRRIEAQLQSKLENRS